MRKATTTRRSACPLVWSPSERAAPSGNNHPSPDYNCNIDHRLDAAAVVVVVVDSFACGDSMEGIEWWAADCRPTMRPMR